MVDDRTTEEALNDAVRTLYETEAIGEEGLDALADQREMLGNIHNNLNRMDNSLDRAEEVISEMENPWAIDGVSNLIE